jgi:hypothetical protein
MRKSTERFCQDSQLNRGIVFEVAFTYRLRIWKYEVADTTEQIKFTNKFPGGQDIVVLAVTLIKTVPAAVAI